MKNNDFIDTGAWIGRHQAFAAIAGKCTLAQAAALKQLKEARAFEALGLSWADFCKDHLGISRSLADDLIRRLDTLGESYFRLSEFARISPETYRQISGHVTGDIIDLGDEQVPLTPENAPKIRFAIQRLRYKLRQERQRTVPNIAELQMMSDNVLHRAHELAVPTSGTIVREELAIVAAKTSRRWMSLSKSLHQELHPSE